MMATTINLNNLQKTQVDTLIANHNFSDNHYDKIYVDDLDNELTTMTLNTYIKRS